MTEIQKIYNAYGGSDCRDLGARQLEALRDGLKQISVNEIRSVEDGKAFIELLRKFREAVAENDKLHGENYPQLLNSLLSVGEDGLYSNSLRFIFELIQNVDDCEFITPEDCRLDMYFDFNNDEIILTYNESGFTPFNVFAITGIAEAAKNVSASKNEIGEKGIGFKSVFGVADRVLIRSGWFSFELHKENFTIPIAAYNNEQYCAGTKMILYVPGRARDIYRQIRDQYCRKEALFGKNPLLFLNKLTSLKMYYDGWRSMEFKVSRTIAPDNMKIFREDNVVISVNLRDYENGTNRETVESVLCTRYIYPVVYSQKACQSRYGENTLVGSNGGKSMMLQAVVPCIEDVDKVGKGGLYSFLPTQLAFTVPVVCHAPFKLDASREFVDSQDNGNPEGNLWFVETTKYLGELMDYVFLDWAKTANQSIVNYLPVQSESLFAINNGKEECLSCLEIFKGSHYLRLPLFKTIEGEFKRAEDIFCFANSENIREPIKAARLIGASKSLFLLLEGVTASHFGIHIEQNVYNRLFRRALFSSNLTNEILDYLGTVGYEYSENQFPKDEEIKFGKEQLECIMKHKKLADIIIRIAEDAIRNKRRPKFSVSGVSFNSISEVLSGGFDLSEAPQKVEQYMSYCKEKCACIDIVEEQFLPCYNGLVLSAIDPLSSFGAFCYKMDSHDTFAIRVKLREASNRLNQCIENNFGTAEDYIRELRNIRLTVKDSLGARGYKNYLDLILKSGTDRERFIQELLQNADDCVYPQGRIPSFRLTQRDEVIVTEYNEVGFSRDNIRAITAIGESTKNRLLNGDLQSIGEKGVGFKTLFASASEVKIYSGEYNFSLKAEEPTIPRSLIGRKTNVKGTKMEITLKDRSKMPLLKAEDILELCLCLRQLRELDINGHKISIKDTETQRIINVDRKTHVFSRYVHDFVVNDKQALEEKSNGGKVISQKQQIICYVPEKSSAIDYPLYSGLPTKHRIRIPMVIDAPFELTTSREEIETDCAAWNDMIRREMYETIVEVIHARKVAERANALRFARFRFQISGTQRMYVNDISDLKYLNDYDYLNRLRSERILPTFNTETFVSVCSKAAYKCPEAVIFILNELSSEDYIGLRPEMVIDHKLKGTSKEQKERVEAIFNALACETAPYENVFSLLQKYAEDFIENEEFRKCLYDDIQNIPEEFKNKLKDMKLIPVYGKKGGTQYISWNDNRIFVKTNTYISDKAYWVLNETKLSKSTCEKMLGININEMNLEWEKGCYKEKLKEIINDEDIIKVYEYLISEFANGALKNNDCLGILLENEENIPLKNELGKITCKKLFLCNRPTGYFTGEMLQRLIVNGECEDFADFIKCHNLSDIHYEDMKYYEELTANDIEALQDEYFIHSEEILRGFYRDGYISDELLEAYELEYIGMGRANDLYINYLFPEKPVNDREQLIKHILTTLKDPIKIFSSKVERSILKGCRKNGDTFDLNGNEARNKTLKIYTPEGAKNIAFCQMCCKVKPYMLMEVNNLELKPKYYFHQTRVALCLECSKRFEAKREKENIREDYLDAIRCANILHEGRVEIPIGNDDKLTFTATHLAEVQEILNKMPE